MPSDLHDLLQDAAREPRQPLDTERIRGRAQRGRRLEMTGIVVAVLALIAGIIGIASWATQPQQQPVIGPAPGAPASPEPTDGADEETSASPTAAESPAAETAAATSCAEHDDRVDAAPSDDGTLDLYLSCDEGDPFEEVLRTSTDIEETGDPVADARAIIERLFTPLSEELDEQGYTGLTRDVYRGPDQEDATIGVGDISFADGTLTIDFDFPATGVGNYSTSAGSMLWHNLVTANLLQLDDVERLELLADGTCEGYSRAFEGRECVVADRASAPWNR